MKVSWIQSFTAGPAIATWLTEPGADMTLRIEKVSDGRIVIFRLSGRLQSEHVEELRPNPEGRPGLGASQTREP